MTNLFQEVSRLYRKRDSGYNLSTMCATSDVSRNLLANLSAIASRCNCQAYVVGGFVRDWLLGRETVDIDIAVSCDPGGIAARLADTSGGKAFLLDSTNRVFRVVVGVGEKQWQLDITCFSGSIENDLARRDFTVNAMAVRLEEFISDESASVIDPFAGRNDLEARIIRAVRRDIFRKDAVRLLRAVRLARELEFTIEPGTEGLIRKHSRLTASVPGERVREELLRMLAIPGSAGALRYLDDLGLLTEIIPELRAMKGVEQPKEHYWDVFDHSIETVSAVEFLLRESSWKYGGCRLLDELCWSQELREHFDEEVANGSSRRLLLKLGALLHDVAKPATKTIDETGRIRFIGHTKLGAAMAASILQRLRFSNREVRLVENLVYNHLRPVQMSSEGLPTRRAVYRFFRDTEGAGVDVLFLALADFLATQGPKLDISEWKRHNQLVSHILQEYRRQQSTALPVKLLDGHDLMGIFGLKPGRLIGELLAEVREAQAAGDISTREEAIELVRRHLEKRQCSLAC